MEDPNERYIIATIKSWNIERAHRFIDDNPELGIELITDKDKLTFSRITEFNPKIIFFPHWSWIIPQDIYTNFECVVFHMTDLPFGRGGSPLQNLISRGIYKTKISALKVVKGVDAGPIYIKRELDLQGSATKIFRLASEIVFGDMIPSIIRDTPASVPQKGKVVTFGRRTAEQSSIADLKDITKIYDYIRMLDAEGYPAAFIVTSELKIEFSDAKLQDDCVLAQAKIEVKCE